MSDASLRRISSGVPGLDTILHGGFIDERMYLILGEPGTGKTLLGMSFLETGLENDENVLFIHSEESRKDILVNGNSVGIDLSGADFLDLGPDSDFFSQDHSYELVNPKDLESEQVIEDIRETIEQLDPDRVLFDPITQLRAIEPSENQYRKRLVSFMRFLRGRGTTVLATQTPGGSTDNSIESLSDGVIRLQRAGSGRRITVKKHRGVGQHEGSHGLEIREDGLEVFPRLDPEPYRTDLGSAQFGTGIPAFDQLLGGGIERGTVTILTGPSGVGKTTLATKFIAAAAADGRPAAMYQFEEAVDKLTHRAESFGIPVTELQQRGPLRIEAIEPLTLSAEEFAQRIKEQAAEHGTELVVIDGTEGYQLSLHGEPNGLVNSLHALTRYLTSTDITVVLVDQSEGTGGMIQPTSRNFSYLADNVVVLNYIERGGAKERVASVLKKRVGSHEETVRPYTIGDDGIRMREPVPEIEGFLSGQPEYGERPDGRNS